MVFLVTPVGAGWGCPGKNFSIQSGVGRGLMYFSPPGVPGKGGGWSLVGLPLAA